MIKFYDIINCLNKNLGLTISPSKIQKWFLFHLNPIQDEGGGAKRPPTSFSPVTSTNVGFSPKNFLTCSFNPFATLL